VSGVQGTVGRHVHVLRQRARPVRRLLVHDEQAAPADAAQVSAVPIAARPSGRRRLHATDDGHVRGRAARPVHNSGRPTGSGTGLRAQAERDHVRREGDVRLPAERVPLSAVRAVVRHARGPVPARPARPVHGARLPVVRRVR